MVVWIPELKAGSKKRCRFSSATRPDNEIQSLGTRGADCRPGPAPSKHAPRHRTTDRQNDERDDDESRGCGLKRLDIAD